MMSFHPLAVGNVHSVYFPAGMVGPPVTTAARVLGCGAAVAPLRPAAFHRTAFATTRRPPHVSHRAEGEKEGRRAARRGELRVQGATPPRSPHPRSAAGEPARGLRSQRPRPAPDIVRARPPPPHRAVGVEIGGIDTMQ